MEKLKRLFRKQPQQNRPQQPPKKKKSCRRIIKRDPEGRIREERFEGCSPQEIKMMKEQGFGEE